MQLSVLLQVGLSILSIRKLIFAYRESASILLQIQFVLLDTFRRQNMGIPVVVPALRREKSLGFHSGHIGLESPVRDCLQLALRISVQSGHIPLWSAGLHAKSLH